MRRAHLIETTGTRGRTATLGLKDLPPQTQSSRSKALMHTSTAPPSSPADPASPPLPTTTPLPPPLPPHQQHLPTLPPPPPPTPNSAPNTMAQSTQPPTAISSKSPAAQTLQAAISKWSG